MFKVGLLYPHWTWNVFAWSRHFKIAYSVTNVHSVSVYICCIALVREENIKKPLNCSFILMPWNGAWRHDVLKTHQHNNPPASAFIYKPQKTWAHPSPCLLRQTTQRDKTLRLSSAFIFLTTTFGITFLTLHTDSARRKKGLKDFCKPLNFLLNFLYGGAFWEARWSELSPSERRA